MATFIKMLSYYEGPRIDQCRLHIRFSCHSTFKLKTQFSINVYMLKTRIVYMKNYWNATNQTLSGIWTYQVTIMSYTHNLFYVGFGRIYTVLRVIHKIHLLCTAVPVVLPSQKQFPHDNYSIYFIDCCMLIGR